MKTTVRANAVVVSVRESGVCGPLLEWEFEFELKIWNSKNHIIPQKIIFQQGNSHLHLGWKAEFYHQPLQVLVDAKDDEDLMFIIDGDKYPKELKRKSEGYKTIVKGEHYYFSIYVNQRWLWAARVYELSKCEIISFICLHETLKCEWTSKLSFLSVSFKNIVLFQSCLKSWW